MLLIALLLPASLQAQSTHIVPRLVAETPAIPAGGEVELALVMETEPGWHGYWLNPGDAGLPLQARWRLPESARLGPMRYPTPVEFHGAGLVNYVYEDTHAILMTLTTPPTDAGVLRVTGTLRWLACTDQVCVPEKGEVALAIPVGDGTQRSDEFDAYRKALPRPLASTGTFEKRGERFSIAVPLPADVVVTEPHLFLAEDKVIDYAAPQKFRRVGNRLVVDLSALDEPPGRVTGVIDIGERGLAFEAVVGDVPAGGEAIGDAGSGAVWLALLGAIVGGMFLNLMPCVFPILAMKAMHLARAGGEEREAKRDALGYTLGAVLGTAALGGLLLAIRAGGEAAGWAFQLQDPRTVFLLVLLAGAITLNLLGFFRLPVLAGDVRASGSVATGALAALVATPCAGPFLGTALGTALVLPIMAGIGVFAALGFGLAVPFLLVAFIPSLRRRLPKPGPWMARLQRWLAIPMAATLAGALWLLWRLAGAEALLIALAALVLVAALLWLSRRSVAFGWMALAGSVALAVGGAVLLPARTSAERAVPGYAQPWSEEAVAAARAEGRPVFVDFTADWCLSCKANEKVAIERDGTLAAFERADVAVFVADWTDGDPAITRFLDKRGRAGVPLYLWYAPGAAEPEELPQILTQDMLVSRAQASN